MLQSNLLALCALLASASALSAPAQASVYSRPDASNNPLEERIEQIRTRSSEPLFGSHFSSGDPLELARAWGNGNGRAWGNGGGGAWGNGGRAWGNGGGAWGNGGGGAWGNGGRAWGNHW